MTQLEQYRRYRSIGQQLHTRIPDAALDQEAIVESGEVLGIDREGDVLLYDDEVEMTVHYEFVLHEYRRNGRTAVQQFYERDQWDTDDEKRYLEAVRAAETSLYEVVGVEDTGKSLTVIDRMNGEAGISVTDGGLSGTVEPGILLFFRLVPFEAFNMTSGLTLPFPPDEGDRLLSEYELRSDRVDAESASARRFATFYRLYREYVRY